MAFGESEAQATAPEAACRIDASHRLVTADPELADAIGVAAEALGARPLHAVLAPFCRTLEATEAFALVQRCAPVRAAAVPISGADGAPFRLVLDLWPQFDCAGAYTGHVGMRRIEGRAPAAPSVLGRGEREAAAAADALARLAAEGDPEEIAVSLSAAGLAQLGALGPAAGLIVRVDGLGAVLDNDRARFALDSLAEAGAEIALSAPEALSAPFGALFALGPAALRCDAVGGSDAAEALARALGARLETADADGTERPIAPSEPHTAEAAVSNLMKSHG